MNNNYRPLVSIMILNWNRTNETIRAIDSALKQSYHEIEIIVIDNGSDDKKIGQKISSLNADIKYYQLDKNYGCPGGRNRGIGFCNGEFIFFVDNDGILHKDAIKMQFKLFNRVIILL